MSYLVLVCAAVAVRLRPASEAAGRFSWACLYQRALLLSTRKEGKKKRRWRQWFLPKCARSLFSFLRPCWRHTCVKLLLDLTFSGARCASTNAEPSMLVASVFWCEWAGFSSC